MRGTGAGRSGAETGAQARPGAGPRAGSGASRLDDGEKVLSRWDEAPALASADIIPTSESTRRYAAAREHGMHALRHFYISVLQDAGENINALSLCLGHSDPGFTLPVYTYLMSSSLKAVSAMYRSAGHAHDGPKTAQAA